MSEYSVICSNCVYCNCVCARVCVCLCIYSMIGIHYVSVWVCVCECALTVPAVAAQSGTVGLIPSATLCQAYHRAESN